MIVYRLSKSKYARDLSGTGAEKVGGRWNSRGVAILYTSASRALCTTEIAVHMPLGIIPKDYQLVTIDIPDDNILELIAADLPRDWRSIPHADSTQKIGDSFVAEGEYLVLKVPSVVVPGDFNYLINPQHEYASKVKVESIEPFSFDRRLFVKS